MSKPSEKLAESLSILRKLQKKVDSCAIRTKEISRTNRERLVSNNFLKEVTKGWYIATNPSERHGDSTSWFSSYWEFCSRYLNEKYDKNYCLASEQSIMLHAGSTTIPNQIIVLSPKAPNKLINLIHNTSIFEMSSEVVNKYDTIESNGIRILSIEASLVKTTEHIYNTNPIEMITALSLIRDSSKLLEILLEGTHSVVAGRLAGAFRSIGQVKIANDIVETMKAADFNIKESNPFSSQPNVELSFIERSPYVNRIKLMWESYREKIITVFPENQRNIIDKQAYLKSIEDIYTTDAYHSLSIENYKVTEELINKVKDGSWDTENNEEDKKQKDAMAAKGYYLAMEEVKKSIVQIIENKNPGKVVDNDHPYWYRALFSPSVSAGIIKPAALAGYRNGQVYITNSQHVPLNSDAVRDAIPTFFELLEKEENAGVRAVLGHYIFVYIHPYMDGNGRMARFLMNAMLASGGYPWTVIPVESRDEYMNALEHASVNGNIEPFAIYISDLVKSSLEGKPIAKI